LQGQAGHVENRDVGGSARELRLGGQNFTQFQAGEFRRPLGLADLSGLRAVVNNQPGPFQQARGEFAFALGIGAVAF
jgi:hypothetical protein